MSLMYQCVARSDDLRLLDLAHLGMPYNADIGPAALPVWQLMVKGSKAEKVICSLHPFLLMEHAASN